MEGRGRRRRGAAAAAVVLVLGGLLGARARGAAAERLIRYEKDALTVRLTNVPVAEVLDELRRQTGAEVRGQPCTPGAVSAEFEAVSLGDALHRLLGEQNFALVFGDGGRLKTVRLLGGPDGPAAAPPSGASGRAVRGRATRRFPVRRGRLSGRVHRLRARRGPVARLAPGRGA